jgi:uracil-DNA glycosylase
VPSSSLARALDQHCEQLAACRLCGHLDVLPVISLARQPKAMLIGQAPGQTERTGRRSFAGRAGKTLFQWIERAEVSEELFRKKIYIAAVTRCYPGPSPTGRGDRVPNLREQGLCRRWLDDELHLIKPRLIIPVGKLAIEQFLPKRPLAELIGREHRVGVAGGESVVIPLPHPSGASSWIHMPGHRELLDHAIDLLRVRLADLLYF